MVVLHLFRAPLGLVAKAFDRVMNLVQGRLQSCLTFPVLTVVCALSHLAMREATPKPLIGVTPVRRMA